MEAIEMAERAAVAEAELAVADIAADMGDMLGDIAEEEGNPNQEQEVRISESRIFSNFIFK